MSSLGYTLSPDYGAHPPEDIGERLFDACVIGSGAAGAVAAHALVEAGLDVVMLEQGPFVNERMSYADVVKESELAYVRTFSGCWAPVGFPWTSNNVGGGTVFYGAASFRYREVDFDASGHFPEAELPLKWPYDYAELEPYYDEIERLLGVAADPSGDPTAPPSPNASYLPPIEPSACGALLARGALALGAHPFPTPLAIATVPYRGREACAKDTPCVERRCARGAKGDVVTTLLKPLLLAGDGLTLYAGMKVARLERDQLGNVSSVSAVRVDTRRAQTFRARHFVVACSAVESAALLLRSADARSPHGLGNDHDMVGRGLSLKASEWLLGWHNATGDPGVSSNNGPFSTVSITDWYLDPSAPGGLGGLIYEAGVGSAHRSAPGELGARIECILADIPTRDNRVRLVRDQDAFGLPRVALDYTPHPKDQARLEHMIARAEAVLRAAGCTLIRRYRKDYRLGVTHLHGTCRAGNDPKTSVVDGESRVHEIDNLWVIDGAFMPFPGGVNPTLTIQAHALRASRKLAGHMG
jgi:choline dehydrogenase-like flavoprotein